VTGEQSSAAADVRRVRPGVYSVLIGGRSYEVVVDVEVEVGEDVTGTATVDGRQVPVLLQSARRRAIAAATGSAGVSASGPITVVAPMPGRIVGVPVAQGDAVERGQTVVVLEAMKMESAITAAQAGLVSEVLVAPGQAVQQRQPLLRIEPHAPAGPPAS
jgi:glutaconyl-CoA/methylmalonyl-CoA decarboxylase subunit gamma